MTPDSTTPDRLTALLIAQRANLAWAMIGLGIISAGVGVYCVSKLAARQAASAKDDSADKDAEPLAPPTPYRTEYLIGAMGGLLGAVAGFGVGGSIIAAARKSTAATLPADARVAVLLAGGAAGLVLVVVGLAYFLTWSPLLARWLDEKVAPPGAYKVISALLVFLVGAGLAFLAAQPARAEERNAQNLRRLVYGLNFALGVLLLVVVLVAGNAFAALKVPAKLDTTESGFYTLSDATKGYLANLPEPVTIYTTFPEGESRMLSDARNLVAAAQAVNPQKVTVRYLSDVLNRNEITQLKTKYPTADLNEYGILLTAGDDGKRSAYIRPDDLFSREPDATGRSGSMVFRGEAKFVQELLGITESGARPVVYFTQGAGELALGGGPDDAADPRRSAGQLKTVLEKGYATVRPLNFAAGEGKVPDDAAVVVVADPTQTLPERQANAVRDFAAGGPKGDGKKGKLVVLAGAHAGLDGRMTPTGLEGVLAGLGVRLPSDFLYNEPLSQFGPTTTLASAGSALVRSRNSLALAASDFRALPLDDARVVEVARGPEAGPVTAEALLVTSRGRLTWLEPTRSDPIAFLQSLEKLGEADIREAFAKRQASQGSRTVAAVVSEGTTPRAVVFGAGEFFADQTGRQLGGQNVQAELFAAAVNWLRDRPPVANIANKTYGTYTLSRDADNVPLFWLPVGVTLTGVLAAGLGVWLLRRM
jgi:uncharacterized membrane protein